MARNQSQREQFKPLAPFISSSPSPFNNNKQAFSEQQTIRVKKFVRWCGCVTALVSILAVIVIVLGFTVYNVKQPEVRMNSVTLLNGSIPTNGTSSSGNITLLADVSVKNPNAFTFRFGSTTTNVFYDGIGIGQGTTPPGKAKARRTLRYNVTMHVMANKMMEDPTLRRDMSEDQALNISSYTRIDGKVKVLNLFKRKVVVELNCTIEYNVTTGLTSHGDNCLGQVSI